MVRLQRVTGTDSVFPVGVLRDSILEYRYTSKENFGLKGYNGASTHDFALNIYLEKEIEARDLVAESTDLEYVFDEPTIYYQDGDEWAEMDPNHQERFFHVVTTGEGEESERHLSIIGDNSDECGIHNLYITVPVLQRATVAATISDAEDSKTKWVLDSCTFNSSDTQQEVKKTYYFDKFYMNLFDLQIGDSRDENGNLYDETKDIYSQVGVMKILLEDLH